MDGHIVKDTAILDYGIEGYGGPEKGEQTAVMHTNYGDIWIRFFPWVAPLAVENFTTHAKDGYYDGVILHRVIADFMIQGGDPEGTGYGGESIWGGTFEDEFLPSAHNLRGALSMANGGEGTNGSQFFIVQAPSVQQQMINSMKQYPDSYPPEFVAAYEKYGGTPWLDFKHTVFGFVFCGMKVVDAIAATAVDENSRPVEDIVIKSIEISGYDGIK